MPAAISRRDLFGLFRSCNIAERGMCAVGEARDLDLWGLFDSGPAATPQDSATARPGGRRAGDAQRGASEAWRPAALGRDGNPDRGPRTAAASGACLERRGIACRVCEAGCETAAIRFLPARGGCRTPQIDPARCVGCADCVAACPAAALALVPAAASGQTEVAPWIAP